MQEKDKFFFRMQKRTKNVFTLYLQVVQSKLVFDPAPHSSSGVRAWTPSLPTASPGNNQNNFQLGRKKIEFQMKGEQVGFGWQCLKDARAFSPPFPFPPAGSLFCDTWRWQVTRQPLPSFSPRGRPVQPRHPTRAGPLRATPAELQFDISRSARARLEPEHVPGCFIAAAAAAGPGGCVCACVCECV